MEHTKDKTHRLPAEKHPRHATDNISLTMHQRENIENMEWMDIVVLPEFFGNDHNTGETRNPRVLIKIQKTLVD
jgi:hypothetical protein